MATKGHKKSSNPNSIKYLLAAHETFAAAAKKRKARGKYVKQALTMSKLFTTGVRDLCLLANPGCSDLICDTPPAEKKGKKASRGRV